MTIRARHQAIKRRYLYRLAVPKEASGNITPSPYFHFFNNEDKEKVLSKPRAKTITRFELYPGYWQRLPHPENKFMHEHPFPLDMDKFREVIAIFTEGTCHFQPFIVGKKSARETWKNSGEMLRMGRQYKTKEYFSRQIEKAEVSKVPAPSTVMYNPVLELFDFYDVELADEGFFRHQVWFYCIFPVYSLPPESLTPRVILILKKVKAMN